MESRSHWRRLGCGPQEGEEVWLGEFAIWDARGKHPPGRAHVSKPSMRLPGGYREGFPTGRCCTVDTHEKIPLGLAETAHKEGSSARGHQVLQEPSRGAHKDLAETPSPLVSTPSGTTHY